MKNPSTDAIHQLLEERDALNSIGHLLLNELEALVAALVWADAVAKECGEELKDARAVIEHAKKVLLPV